MFSFMTQDESSIIPDSKVHGANMGPSGADRTQVGPMLAHEFCYLGYDSSV